MDDLDQIWELIEGYNNEKKEYYNLMSMKIRNHDPLHPMQRQDYDQMKEQFIDCILS